MGIINTEMIGLGVRDAMLFGPETFPNAPRFHRATLFIPDSKFRHDVFKWCEDQFGRANFFRSGGDWFFTYERDATFFRLTWTDSI